eukprot:1917795-Pyramimonas_sp.AAC.1
MSDMSHGSARRRRGRAEGCAAGENRKRPKVTRANRRTERWRGCKGPARELRGGSIRSGEDAQGPRHRLQTASKVVLYST